MVSGLTRDLYWPCAAVQSRCRRCHLTRRHDAERLFHADQILRRDRQTGQSVAVTQTLYPSLVNAAQAAVNTHPRGVDGVT